MQFILSFVVLVLAIGVMLFASPVIFYMAPLIIVGLIISLLMDRHKSRTIKH